MLLYWYKGKFFQEGDADTLETYNDYLNTYPERSIGAHQGLSVVPTDEKFHPTLFQQVLMSEPNDNCLVVCDTEEDYKEFINGCDAILSSNGDLRYTTVWAEPK